MLVAANPRDAPHSRRQRRRQEILPQMNADRPVSRVRDWLNARVGHRHICVHLRSSAAKISFFLIGQPQQNATRQDLAHPRPATRPGSTGPFKPFRIDPMDREPAAKSAPTAPFKAFRIDPMDREPAANSAPTAPFKPFRTDPLNREPTAKPGPTAPRVAGSKAFSAAATAQPARVLHQIALVRRPTSLDTPRPGVIIP
jgi:hypothetical protein